MWCVVFCSVPVVPTAGLRARLDGASRVIAADGGCRNALAFGMLPDAVVGDLDSIEPAVVEELHRRGVPVHVLPTDKDTTDGEEALRLALTMGATRVSIVGALGGPRFDHAVANILLLTLPELTATDVSLLDERQEVRLLHAAQTWRWPALPGELVSLLPLDGAVRGVTALGLRWPLRGEALALGPTRGISNEAVDEWVSVGLTGGQLLVIRRLPADAPDWPVRPD